jgi:hypothetical protein
MRTDQSGLGGENLAILRVRSTTAYSLGALWNERWTNCMEFSVLRSVICSEFCLEDAFDATIKKR